MQADRNHAVDMVRAVALIGICVVNLPFLGLPLDRLMEPPADSVDRWAVMAVEGLFQAKFFLLFSFIFGWGLEIQAAAAQRVGASFPRRFRRRLLTLAVLGLLHAALVFSGDILFLYAILGAVAFAVRSASIRQLVTMAGALVPVAALGVVAVALVMADMALPPLDPNLGGSYGETVRARLAQWPDAFGFLVLFQGPLALAAFLLGMAAARVGFFDANNRTAARLVAAAPALFLSGLVINAAYVVANFAGEAGGVLALIAYVGIVLGGPLLAASYLGLIVWLSAWLHLPRWCLTAGRNSLSTYVLQGVLAGFAFGGYGLGLFGQLGQAALIGVALVVAVAAMILVAATARWTGHGPLEHLLRRITYG